MALRAAEPAARARPYGTSEGSEYEHGTGIVTGERLTGELRFTRTLRHAAGGTATVALSGLITTSDGALVHFQAGGREGAAGRGLLVVSLLAQDARYAWLNPLVCLGEGVFERDPGHSHIVISAYV